MKILRGTLAFFACFVCGFVSFSLFTLSTEHRNPTLTLTAAFSYKRDGIVLQLLSAEAKKGLRSNCTLEHCRNRLSSANNADYLSCMRKAKITTDREQESSCVFLSSRDRPLIALASFPGSGNTWVRGLLQKATGICTGATYCDISLRTADFPGEGISSPSVLVVKTHNSYPHWAKKGTPSSAGHKDRWNMAILLIRNPFDALVSEWNRRQANLGFVETKVKSSHTDSVGPEYFGSNKEWDKFVREKAPLWLTMIKQYLVSNWHHPVLVVSYEMLKNDTFYEMKRMLDFLQVTYQPTALEQIVSSDFKAFHRAKAAFEHYTKPQIQLVRTLVTQAKSLLAQNKKYALQFVPFDDYSSQD